MRLAKFEVKNFRSVTDSGPIETEQVTALVGVNESGKTNLLLPLWKLNPAREGEFRPTSDYPKGNYAAVRGDPGGFEFVTAEFECAEYAGDIARISGVDSKYLDVVSVTRYFDEKYTISFPKHKRDVEFPLVEIKKQLEEAREEILAITPRTKESTIKSEMLRELDDALQSVPERKWHAKNLEGLAAKLEGAIPNPTAATRSLVPRFQQLIDGLKEAVSTLNQPAPGEIPEVTDLIFKQLHRFVYYSNYGNLDSEIYLPHVVQNLKRNDLGAREAAKARTLRVLFNFVTLQPEEILELGRDFKDPQARVPSEQEIANIATKKRDRTILLNSAATNLTKKFRDWWKQGDYTFEFQADGDHFRIWVSDSKRPEKVELEDRSSGLQWFLSFYLIFLVESSRDHRGAILLLDEPGLSLHPLAQRDLSAFFENLSQSNYLHNSLAIFGRC